MMDSKSGRVVEGMRADPAQARNLRHLKRAFPSPNTALQQGYFMKKKPPKVWGG